jgi:hypothetical protein
MSDAFVAIDACFALINRLGMPISRSAFLNSEIHILKIVAILAFPAIRSFHPASFVFCEL